MINMTDDDITSFGDDTLTVPCLKDLHDELLVECLDEQIKNPTSSHVYYLDEFKEAYEEDMEEANDDEDEKKELKSIHDRFYKTVLDKINRQYDLGLDEDVAFSLPSETLRTLAEGIYEFFIVEYTENVTEYFTEMVDKFQEALVTEITKNSDLKDIVSDFFKDKIKDESSAIIVANMNGAIKYLKDIDIDPGEFIDLFDCEKFSVAVVKNAIENGVITGNFIKRFLAPVFSKSQGDVFDGIVVNTRQNVYEKYLESENK